MDLNKVVSPQELEIYQNAINKSIKDANANIKKWNEYKSDYLKLKNVLKDLPNEIQHEAMIPFSKLAFFPGKLIHTNEVLVLLGDNWFVERSAKQACEIVDRRVKFVNENLYKLKKDKKELEEKIELTKKNLPIKHEELNEEGMNYVEIREDFDEQEEAKINEITDKTSKIHIDMSKEDKKKKEFSAEDEAIFEMLKQAELEEEMENEKNKENEYEDFIKSLKEYDQENEKDVKGKKRADTDSEDNEEEEEEEENNDNINFEHLKEKFKLYKEKEIQKMKQEEKENKIFEDIDNKKENTNDNSNNNTFMDMSQIKNPADIYRHIYNINEQAKKNMEKLENEKKANESSANIKIQSIQENNNNNNNISSSISNTVTPISSKAADNNTKIKENSYISQIKPKIPKKKKSSLFKSHMMEQRKKQGVIEKDIIESNPVKDVVRPVERQTVTGGVKSIVQEHDVNNDYRAPTPKKNKKVSYFKRMAEAQYGSSNENQIQNSNKNINSVPIMQNTIKENPNNTALDEDDIDFYFTQREANQEYQKRKYQKSLIAKEKPLEEYDENDN